jgi:flagellar protein FliO/FliZ
MLLLQQTAGGYALLAAQALAVLAVIAALAWLFTRFVGPRLGLRGRGARMRVVERLHLEPRRSLYIVEVDGESLLVGVADGAVNLVAMLGAAGDGEEASAGGGR